MQFFYGQLNERINNISKENIYIFQQKYYTPLNISLSKLSMGEKGFIYVPTNCKNKNIVCKLHIFFHGCKMTLEDIGEYAIFHSGLNEWAESNNIIILYPQVIRSYLIPYNPQGCWDWWGYTGTNYATKLAPQIITINNMIHSLIEINK